MIDTILTAVLTVAPVLVIALWAWFKAHAASSAAKWDDEAVALVEKIAQNVVAGKVTPVTGVDH